uniref:Uncharacterized protein LOC104237841 n=1 Tax=Nicotiana sylvestris TaxID=4096 RepID=A0A1U7XE83_NICSY|nr:PREDICTED: uncharacterized protein LOC104237841 [Nicotiana sylvestris]
MKKEAADYVQRCEQCQKYAPMIHQAGELLHSVTSPWPFIKWGMDIAVPLTAGRGKKLKEAKGLWPKLLPEVLWAYRTTPKSSMGETPYLLVYGIDIVIPVEVGEPSLRYSNESGEDNDKSRLQDLDEVEEQRDMAHVRMVSQKQQVERYYNKRAKVRSLKISDYILKAKKQASKDPYEGKLGTNWDGPYKIVAAANKERSS